MLSPSAALVVETKTNGGLAEHQVCLGGCGQP
jgi:hypothetical protein